MQLPSGEDNRCEYTFNDQDKVPSPGVFRQIARDVRSECTVAGGLLGHEMIFEGVDDDCEDSPPHRTRRLPHRSIEECHVTDTAFLFLN